MKKLLTVLCLALLLTLVCAGAMAAIDPKYTSNGLKLSTLTTYKGESVVDVVLISEPKCKTGIARITTNDGISDSIYDVPVDVMHDLELKMLDGSSATCQSAGYGVYYCKDCGQKDPTNAGVITIEPKEHKYDKVIIDVARNHEHGGKQHNVCIWCGEPEKDGLGNVIYTNTPKCDGAFSADWVIEQKQTCKDKGLRYHVCTLCGEPERAADGKIKYDPAYNVLGDHTYGDFVVTKNPTCLDGMKVRYCSVCNKEDTQVIPATSPHSLDAVVKTVIKCSSAGGYAQAATDADVVVVKRCAVCGYEEPGNAAMLSGNELYANHKFVDDPTGVNIPAECNANGTGLPGKETVKCTKCGGIFVKTIAGPTKHNFGPWVMKMAPGKDGTENGAWERTCTNYHCIEKETYVGKTAPKGADPVPTTKPDTTTSTPTGSENYKITSWSFNGSSVTGQVKGNVSYRTPGLAVNVIIYTPTGTFLATSAAVDENGLFSVSAGGAVYAVSIQLKDNSKTYQTDGKYV